MNTADKPLNGAGLAIVWTVIQTILSEKSIPSGAIVMWSGSIDDIPTGWLLCDGTNGAPDLRDRFVIGAGSSYSVGSKGGSETTSVALTTTKQPTFVKDSDTTFYGSLDGSETSKSVDNIPPYYALAYIMKS